MSENKKKNALPTVVTAHCGFAAAGGIEDRSEDNTLDNIIKSINYGPDAIEVDVHYVDTDGDGVPDTFWLGHDGADASVNPSAEDVLLLLLGRHERAAELQKPVDNVRIQFDLKSENSVFAAIELAEKVGFPMNRLFIAGALSYDFVMENRERLLPFVEQGLELWLSMMEIQAVEDEELPVQDLDFFAARLRALRLPRIVMNAHYKTVTDEVKARMDAEGVPVSLWTLNSIEAVESQMERGMDTVTTRMPECLSRRNALRDK